MDGRTGLFVSLYALSVLFNLAYVIISEHTVMQLVEVLRHKP